MITFWQQESGKIVRCEKEEIDTSSNVWVDARSVTREDIRELEEEYGIEQEHILDILDQDELSRIEKEDNYTLIIARLPVFMPSSDISYFTVPLGIILFPDKIITICWTDCEVLKDLCANRVRSLTLNDFPAFITRVLSRADSTFLRYLKEINRRSTTIQSELQLSIKNNELIQLLNLEKSLVFFTTSLKSNQLLLEKLIKTKTLTFDEDDREWLEDVEIDNRQAIEMADTYSNILSGMMDAFASVISNNLNIVMKRLTVISLILMVPTFIVSFFGMNVPLPLMENGWLGVLVISAVCGLSALFAGLLLKEKQSRQHKPRKYRIKKQDEKTEKKIKRVKKNKKVFTEIT
ncbi:MAG TPA: magnesium transporter CorA family protein [Treponemataceae bacterium]|nr:magnesium transporter CorA family protein [Treponemataceae bacterium]HQL04793.1 magnesium transporter CorA family protein [Treponemataceae bacterium]